MVIVKVDFEKAYNSVSWDFLYYMIERLGFNDKWVGRIKQCMESSSISILVNCSPNVEFAPDKGFETMGPFGSILISHSTRGSSRVGHTSS